LVKPDLQNCGSPIGRADGVFRAESDRAGQIMGDVINLNRFRKQRERTQREAQAAVNRTRFGRTKDEKKRDVDDTKRQDRDLDGKKLDDPV
jgi:hypothetical protein